MGAIENSVRSKNVLIEEFLDRMLADPGSQLLVWLTIFHRLAAVENDDDDDSDDDWDDDDGDDDDDDDDPDDPDDDDYEIIILSQL
ncbi:unnamed protein product [Echinostoma caproni]|uniref:Uncharacterized protein n=1 Tax=Echinostoma caproni TaxID=27848 RepID=A0A183AP25_9TREM|nr:unnamed protein product [Echinostoma caproni]